MKKVLIICAGVVVAIVILVVCLELFHYNSLIQRDNGVEITASQTDNRYNNTKANYESQLVQIKDKLYYYYDDSIADNGLYEISTEGTQRVFSHGFAIHPYGLNLDDVLDDKILESADGERYLNTQTHRYEGSQYIYKPDGKQMAAFIQNNRRYFVSEDKLLCYDDETKTYVVLATGRELMLNGFGLDSFASWYFDGQFLYYPTFQNEIVWLYRFDTESKRITNKCSLEQIPDFQNVVGSILADGEDVFLQCSDGTIYRLNFANNQISELFRADGQICMNYYQKKLFVACYGRTQGIYVIDMSNPDNKRKIADRNALEIYILDNKYVYFIDERKVLYRVTTDGSQLQKLFG